MVERLIGDSAAADATMYTDVCDIATAQTISDLVCSVKKWPRVEVVRGRAGTVQRHGSIMGINSVAPMMRLNKPSVGVVLHELAHLVNREHNRQENHNHNFKRVHKELIGLWYGSTRTEIKRIKS